jgi:hypothetical protein
MCRWYAKSIMGAEELILMLSFLGAAFSLQLQNLHRPDAPWLKSHILPVIHNLEPFQVPYIIDALDGFECCTVSLRHANALESLKELTDQFGPYCKVGVSTVVSVSQVKEYKRREYRPYLLSNLSLI